MSVRQGMLERGADLSGITLRATVPVNLRPLEHAKKLGNHFGLVFLDLPIGEPNPLRRLERVAASMRDLKGRRQAVVAFGLLAALGMAPAALQGPALELFSRKATAVATNVPGPQQPLFMRSARLPTVMDPASASMPRNRAGASVAARSASAGSRPASTSKASSSCSA